ncbi:DUF1156 domain-containing protein, partial [Phormidium sp. FACHB-1136]|uniref:DUF1156 domain-containing protein n=1 Tax=Phormidium sp. FACHB-1136 TaxID=2692848 RepID=UPI001684E709
MTEPTPKPTRPAVFIEKIFPVTLLNQQVYYEHGGNPFKGLHRWYSRKPLSFSRASVLGSLLPDTVTVEEFEYLLGLDRARPEEHELHRMQRWGRTKLYKTPPSPERIKQVHDLCEQTWGTRTPTVLDAFAGGGSIPFEAVRYGLNVLASDLNPVAVVTMKAAMEYPLKFGPDLQHEIDKWVKWVGDEAEKRLAEFFPSQEGETVQNYLWAHTVVCPSCESVVPLSPNWWLYKRPEKQNLHKWCAVRPIPNLAEKRVDFELVKGAKGKGSTIQTGQDAYDPNSTVTLREGEGKCPNCDELIDEKVICSQAKSEGFGFQLYAIYIRDEKGDINFRLPFARDFEAFEKASEDLGYLRLDPVFSLSIPSSKVFAGDKTDELLNRGIDYWDKIFNPRQLLTVSTYHFLIQGIKEKIITSYQSDHASAILIYLAFILDQCIDKNCRLTNYDSSRANVARATAQHAFGFMWNYPEVSGAGRLWNSCAKKVFGNFQSLCSYLGKTNKQLLSSDEVMPENLVFSCSPASSLFSITDLSVDAVVTDPPYYKTIQYAELSDFFYVWQKGILSDIFPDFFWMELTDKNQEAVTNISRFRNMNGNPEELADRDYEAKMALAFAEYFRVLRDDGVMTVQFNHKDSGAWDVLAKSLIDAGFEITASWAVSTENP